MKFKKLNEWGNPQKHFTWNKTLWTNAGYNLENPIKPNGQLTNYAQILIDLYELQPVSRKDLLLKAGYSNFDRGFLSSMFSAFSQCGLTRYDSKTKKLSIGPNFEEYCYDTDLYEYIDGLNIESEFDAEEIDEALVKAPVELEDKLCDIFTKHNFFIVTKNSYNKSTHFQIATIDFLPDNFEGLNEQEKQKLFIHRIKNVADDIDKLSERDVFKAPITYNFGIEKKNTKYRVTAGVDIHEMHVEDKDVEMDWEDELEESLNESISKAEEPISVVAPAVDVLISSKDSMSLSDLAFGYNRIIKFLKETAYRNSYFKNQVFDKYIYNIVGNDLTSKEEYVKALNNLKNYLLSIWGGEKDLGTPDESVIKDSSIDADYIEEE